jgi:TonB family protein
VKDKIFRVTSQYGLTVLSFTVFLVAAAGVSAQSPPSELQPNPTATQGPANAQSNPGNVQPPSTPAPVALTSAEEPQRRVERARALAAAHQLGAAARELESVRATTGDAVLRYGASVMLMGIYLEEGNYSRAQSLLEETFQARAATRENSLGNYFALSGQAVNGVRQHLARYRSFGVSTGSSFLPPEAVNDLDRLRLLLERMVAQAKEIIRDAPKGNGGLALLEDVLGLRSSLARDSNDRERWQTEYAQAREQLGFARMELASNGESPALAQPISNQMPAQNSRQNSHSQDSGVSQPQIIYAGILNERATERVVPTYPQLAKAAGTEGVVKVHVVVNEGGDVRVTKSEGPTLLRQAAEQAARAWRFAPPQVEGKPVRLTGYIEFSFTHD